MGTPTKNITWDIIGTSQVFDLDYSTDNGNTWHRIVNDYSQTGSTGSYSWQVPNVPTTQALVRVVDNGNGVVVDQSDAPFTITSADPVIIVDQPSANSRHYPTQNISIEWRVSNYNVSNVQIELSKDNGQNWGAFGSNIAGNQGAFNYIVPTYLDSVYSNCFLE